MSRPDTPILRTPRRSARVLTLALGAALGLAACGGEADTTATAPTDPDTAAPAPAPAVEAGLPGLESAVGAYLAARSAQAAFDSEAAAKYFDLARASDPNNIELNLRALSFELVSGDVDAATETAAWLLAEGTTIPLAHLTDGTDAMIDEDWPRALTAFEVIERLPAGGLLQPLLTAWALFGQGDVDGALAAIAPIESNEGAATLTFYQKGLLLAAAGRTEAAFAAFRAANANTDATPDRLLRAQVLLRAATGDIAGARAEMAEAVQIRPDLATLQRLKTLVDDPAFEAQPMVRTAREGAAETLFNLADVLSRNDRSRDDASALAQLALALDPGQHAALLLAADLKVAADRPLDAAALLAQVPDEALDGWDARIDRARALHDAERTDEAIALLDGMVAEAPTRTDALNQRGFLERVQERYLDSAATYTEAIARIGTPTRTHWQLFYFRGIAFERAKQWDDAEPDFLKALELFPDQPLVLNYLGYSWIEQRRNLERAFEMIETAVEQRPRDGYIVDSLGWAHYQLGNFDAAVTHLERAVELRPQDAVINDHLGDAYWRVGRIREARFQWERAAGLEIDDPALAETLARKLRGDMDAIATSGTAP